MRARCPTHHNRDRIARRRPHRLVAHLGGGGRLVAAQGTPAVFEWSCFASRRSAHGPSPCLRGLIQPPVACRRHFQAKRGLNAARNAAPPSGRTVPPPRGRGRRGRGWRRTGRRRRRLGRGQRRRRARRGQRGGSAVRARGEGGLGAGGSGEGKGGSGEGGGGGGEGVGGSGGGLGDGGAGEDEGGGGLGDGGRGLRAAVGSARAVVARTWAALLRARGGGGGSPCHGPWALPTTHTGPSALCVGQRRRTSPPPPPPLHLPLPRSPRLSLREIVLAPWKPPQHIRPLFFTHTPSKVAPPLS